MELERVREQIRLNFSSQIPIACNGIKVNNLTFERVLNEIHGRALKFLKEAQNQKLFYCLSEWSKICLFLTFHKSLRTDCDFELLKHFEMARNPNYFEENVNIKRLKGSIGLLHDQFLSILWIMVITVDSKLLLFKININVPNFIGKLQKIHEICSQNTESLKNTKGIAQDHEKKSEWWKLRKSLDSELVALCNEINEDLFSNLSVKHTKTRFYLFTFYL